MKCYQVFFSFLLFQFGCLDLLVTSASTDISMKRLQQAIHKITILRLDHTEMACLKTLSLFRPGKYFYSSNSMNYYRNS